MQMRHSENPCAMNHLQESSYAGGPLRKSMCNGPSPGVFIFRAPHPHNPSAIDSLPESSYAGGLLKKSMCNGPSTGFLICRGSHSNNPCAMDPLLHYSYAEGPTQRIYEQWTGVFIYRGLLTEYFTEVHMCINISCSKF